MKNSSGGGRTDVLPPGLSLSGYRDKEVGTTAMAAATLMPMLASIGNDKWKRPDEVMIIVVERNVCPLGLIKVNLCKVVAAWRVEADMNVKDGKYK